MKVRLILSLTNANASYFLFLYFFCCINPHVGGLVSDMLARSLLRCAAPRRIVSRQWPRAPKGRRYSTASSSVSGGGVQSTAGQGAPMLAAFTEELDKIAPRFDIRGDQVKVLRTPSEFYETLKVCGLPGLS